MTAPLDVTDLRKQFSIGRPAIDGVSFAVPAGEIVVLLGLRAAARPRPCAALPGLSTRHQVKSASPPRGIVAARGILVPPRSRDLGMVFHPTRSGRT